MPKRLSEAEIKFFRENGYLSPVEGVGFSRALEYRNRMDAMEARHGRVRKVDTGSRTHLLFRWAGELIREPAILDAVEDLLGPNLLVFSLTIWVKDPGEPNFVSWHQDSLYHYLDSESVGAWIALTDASIEAGCMEVIPGSHLQGPLPHAEIVDDKNLLPKGQTVANLDERAPTAFMPLALGQFSLHHSELLHRSGANNASHRRIGVAANYVATSAKCISPVKPTASLVRGVDTYGHFDLEPPPKEDYDDAARQAHAEAIKRYAEMKAAMRS